MLDETKPILPQVDAIFQRRKCAILNSASSYNENANLFYVSEHGDDKNDGKSPQTPWKTPAKVSSYPFEKGDVVLFCRGEIFRGSLYAKEGVTYSAYGEGEKPQLYASPCNVAKPELWSLLEGTDNIYVYAKETVDIGVASFDEGKFLSHKEIPSYVNGRYIQRTMLGMEQNPAEAPFDVKKDIRHDLGIFCDCKSVLRTTSWDMDVPDNDNADVFGTLYMRCDKGNPGELFSSIELSPRYNGIYAADGVTVDNLCIKYAGCHGVGVRSVSDLTVKNCVFEYIGGALQRYHDNGTAVRYGNAVEVYGSCRNYTVENCYFNQIYDAAITHQFAGRAQMKNILYKGNLIENSFYCIEYWGGPMTNVLIEDNIIRKAGSGFCEQRLDPNFAACISCTQLLAASVKNNIFDRSTQFLVRGRILITDGYEGFLDNNTYIHYEDKPILCIFGNFFPRSTTYFNPRYVYGEDAVRAVLQDQNGKVYFVEE